MPRRSKAFAASSAVPTCLYIVVVLPPGNRKSEVFRAMTGPLRAAEKTLIEAARPRIAEAVIRRKIAEAAADKTARDAETAAAALDLDKRATAFIDAAEARIELDNAAVPAEPRLFADDTTIEKLGSRLAEQGGRFAVLFPEGEIFSIAAGRYSGAPNLGILKQAHAGEPARTERMGRTEDIEHATLTLGICTQPGVLTRLGDTPEFREQGLLARLLYAVPESRLGWRNPRPDPMPPAVRDRYTATLTALILSLCDLPEAATLTFDPAAAQAVTALLADIEPRFRPGADLAHMTDWGGKLAGATIRIAGLLHLAAHLRDGWDRPITTATLDAATEITGYFTGHAKAAYDTIGADPATAHARAILTWLHHTRPAQITARDLMRAMRDRFTKATDLTAPWPSSNPAAGYAPAPAPPGTRPRTARRPRLGRAPRRHEPAMTTTTLRRPPRATAPEIPPGRGMAPGTRRRHSPGFCAVIFASSALDPVASSLPAFKAANWRRSPTGACGIRRAAPCYPRLNTGRRWGSASTICGTPASRHGSTAVFRLPRSPSGPGIAWPSCSRFTPSASTARTTSPSGASKTRYASPVSQRRGATHEPLRSSVPRRSSPSSPPSQAGGTADAPLRDPQRA